MIEIRRVVGYPDYAVDSDGTIYGKKGSPLKPSTNDSGHQLVVLYQNGKATTRLVHHIVLEAFIGPRPSRMFGCHEDDVPKNNRLSNLRWDTPRSNVFDAYRNGRRKRGEENSRAKFTNAQAAQIRELAREGYTQRELKTIFGCSKGVVQNVVSGRTYTVQANG